MTVVINSEKSKHITFDCLLITVLPQASRLNVRPKKKKKKKKKKTEEKKGEDGKLDPQNNNFTGIFIKENNQDKTKQRSKKNTEG